MIGRKKDLPRVLDQQQQFQTAGPLYGVDQIARPVGVGDDSATGFILDIEVTPFTAGEFVEQMLPGAIGGDCHGVSEEDRSGIGGNRRMRIEVFGKFSSGRADGLPAIATVGMVLRVGDVGSTALEMPERIEGSADVARCAQIVAVQVHRVRQSQFIADAGQLRDDRTGREFAVALDGCVELPCIAAPLPGGHAAGIDRFDAVALGRPEIPGHDVLRPFVFTRLHLVEHDLVVGHQGKGRFIDDRDVGQLFVGVPGRKHRDRRFVDGGPAHAGIEIARGKGSRGHATQAAAACFGADEGLRPPVVLGGHRAGKVDRTAGHMRMHIDSARHYDHPGRVNRASLARCLAEAARSINVQIFNLSIDVVGRIVNFATGDSQHKTRVGSGEIGAGMYFVG